MLKDILFMDYRAHAAFVAPAKARPELWRLVAGAILTTSVFIYMAQLFAGFVFGLLSEAQGDQFTVALQDGGTPGAMLFFLFQLGLLVPAVVLTSLSLHRRGLWSLLGDLTVARQQFIGVLVIQILLVVAIFALPPYGFAGEGLPTRNLSFDVWATLLPIALLALLVQVSAEEIVFRGYLQQQLAARFKSPVVWIGFPAVLFGLGHYIPDSAGANALTIAVWAAIFGIVAADLTARAGTLGPAIAVHLVNNITALLFFAPNDDMYGLALYRLPFGLADEDAVRAWLLVDLGYIAVSWLAARLVLRR